MKKLTDTEVFIVSIEAETDEASVRRLLAGEHVLPRAAARILHALADRGVEIADLPTSPPAPMLNRDGGELVANGRMSAADHGPHFFFSRRDRH